MLKRPSPSEDDAELLRQQEEYFRRKAEKKISPAATAVKSKESVQNDLVEKMEVDSSEAAAAAESIQDQIANTFEAIPTNMTLNRICEKHEGTKDIRQLQFNSQGFPKAVRRDPNIKPPSKGSIFSQNMKTLKRASNQPEKMAIEEADANISLVIKENKIDGSVKTGSTTNFGNLENLATTVQTSNILTASERQQIHDQNMKTIKSMSEEEILAEKEKLMSMLDPALVQFLKSQNIKRKEELENRYPTIEEQNEAAQEVNIDQLKVTKEMLSIPEASDWVNFDIFEANKLAWMKDISVTNVKEIAGFEARFDLEGYLLPHSVAEIDEKNRHLYHHGDEPERPGYSLRELLLLSRSNILQQRIIALNTLGNILAVEQTGIYDHIIDIPIEQVFFVLRVCIDENAPSVLTAAVKALRNLIYFQIDETCLDNSMSFGIGLVQPSLAVDQELNDDNTVNDQQLAETNLVKCLVRTGILIRIRYIVNTVKPPVETIIYCLEILIRLARDSDFIINKIFQTEGLLSTLINQFLPLPKNMDRNKTYYNMPLPEMIKLIRILSSRSRNFAVLLLEKYHMLNVLVYICEDHFSQNAFGMRLQVECMRYWTVLVHYDLAMDSLRTYQNVLVKLLDYHFKHTGNDLSSTLIRQSHVSALMILLAKMAERGQFPVEVLLINDCAMKWLTQFKTFEQFKCGHSQLTSATLYYLATICRCSRDVCDLLHGIIDSNGFNVTTGHVLNGSMLLNNYETHKTTANLKSLEAATWFSMGHIVPVMQTNSCIPLLYCFSTCILNSGINRLQIDFLQHPIIQKYVEKLNNAPGYFNMSNWFIRCESFLIMNILKIAHIVQSDVNSNLFYDLAIKCLGLFRSEQASDIKFLMDNVIFCRRFISIDTAMAKTQISEINDDLCQAWEHLNDIKKVYLNILGIPANPSVTSNPSLTLDMSIGNIIPIDWIYTPLVQLYSNQQKQAKIKSNDDEEFNIILNCLRWILISETYFPTLAGSLSPAEKYVRLSCLFLGSDSFFLNPEIDKLLKNIFQFLVKDEPKINFEQEISGLSNFKDFYVLLLEQYQAVSYGNKTFGNVLLFPLVKRHHIKYRKTLWFEYVGVLEALNVTKEEVWINSNELIYPVETDVPLWKCYVKAVRSIRMPNNSILKEIALCNQHLHDHNKQ